MNTHTRGNILLFLWKAGALSRGKFLQNTIYLKQTTLIAKVHGTNMGPIWCQQDPGGLHVGPMNLALPPQDP